MDTKKPKEFHRYFSNSKIIIKVSQMTIYEKTILLNDAIICFLSKTPSCVLEITWKFPIILSNDIITCNSI